MLGQYIQIYKHVGCEYSLYRVAENESTFIDRPVTGNTFVTVCFIVFLGNQRTVAGNESVTFMLVTL